MLLKAQSLCYKPLVRDEVIDKWCNHLTLDPSPQGEGVGALTGMATKVKCCLKGQWLYYTPLVREEVIDR